MVMHCLKPCGSDVVPGLIRDVWILLQTPGAEEGCVARVAAFGRDRFSVPELRLKVGPSLQRELAVETWGLLERCERCLDQRMPEPQQGSTKGVDPSHSVSLISPAARFSFSGAAPMAAL